MGAQTGLGVPQPNPITWGHGQNWDSTGTLGAETHTPTPYGSGLWWPQEGLPAPPLTAPAWNAQHPRGSPTWSVLVLQATCISPSPQPQVALCACGGSSLPRSPTASWLHCWQLEAVCSVAARDSRPGLALVGSTVSFFFFFSFVKIPVVFIFNLKF